MNTGKIGRGSRLAIIWMVVASLLLAGCASHRDKGTVSESGKRILKIGYLPITHAAPLYLSDSMDKAEFEHFELQLVRFSSWPDLIDALNTGNIDGASVLAQLGMRAKEQGIDLKAVALGHKDGNVVVSAPEINNVTELKGKSFAIPHKFSTHNTLLHQMLLQNGMAYSDVKVVELPPAEMPAALAEGRISGYIVAEPFGAQSVVLDKGKVLYQSEHLWHDSICCILVMRNRVLRDHKKEVEEFVAKYVEAGGLAQLKNDHSRQVMKNYMNVQDQVLDLSLQWITYHDLKLDAPAYEQLRKYMVDMELMKNPPSFEDFVDNSFIDKVMKQ